MSQHFSRDYVWAVITSIASLGSIPYQPLRDLGVTGIYLWAPDNQATNTRRLEIVGQGFKCGLGYPADTRYMYGDAVAKLASDRLAQFAPSDAGQTPVLLDFEPSYGSTQFWLDFIYGSAERQTKGWRGINGALSVNAPRYYRVTDFTPEPFKATQLPVQAFLDARFDVKVQAYFGDMSPIDGCEATLDWLNGLNSIGFPPEAIRLFVDGGRVIKPPIFYQGRKVRNLQPGTAVWNCNLLREAGLV
jgi:hypothetical protein